MKKFENLILDEERALYGLEDASVILCRFEGPADGESAFKECRGIEVSDCYFDLRYPFWHDNAVKMQSCELTPNCRAAFWYSKGIHIENSLFNGIKVLRECADIYLKNTSVNSPECFWFCNGLKLCGGSVKGEYAFFQSNDIRLDNVKFEGKYSFQYVENAIIENSVLDTKDAFWHSKNITVKNSVVKGEYLGWYSENLTLVNCVISGTQPLCYAKGLKLVNCELHECDLSFEYSEVEATVTTHIDSVKNPLSGSIKAKSFGEVIFDESRRDNGDVIIEVL